MYYSKPFWFILLSILFVSCKQQETKNKIILRAENIVLTSPDSAYRLLTSISHPERLSGKDYAAWCLIYTEAELKQLKKIQSDSIIMISIKYYRNSNMTKQSGIAYYLLGHIQRTLGKKEEAMIAFKKAEYLLDKSDENKFKGLVDFNIGDICMEDEIYEFALQYYKKSLNYFILSKEKYFQAYDYRQISEMYNQLDYPFDSVMHYSNLALNLSKEKGDSINYYTVLSQQGELVFNSNYQLSNQKIHQGYRFFPDKRSYYAAFLSYTYSMMHQPDSARYYLHISLSNPSDEKAKVISFLAYANLEKNEGNHKLASEYFEKAFVYRDSIFQKSIKDKLYKIDKQYDLTKIEAKNATLKIENRNNVILIGFLVIILLVVFIIIQILNNRNKKKELEFRAEKKSMEYELKLKKTENDQKRLLLLTKLQNRIENTLRFNRLKSGFLTKEKKDSFLDELTKQSVISDVEWKNYTDEVDHIFDQRISKLMDTYPQLTYPDIKVISLICLKMDISDCCSLLNMTKNAMYHRRNIIKERIGINKEIDLIDWVNQERG
jgi:tetratricopeptide (TPR) repeat protein